MKTDPKGLFIGLERRGTSNVASTVHYSSALLHSAPLHSAPLYSAPLHSAPLHITRMTWKTTKNYCLSAEYQKWKLEQLKGKQRNAIFFCYSIVTAG